MIARRRAWSRALLLLVGPPALGACTLAHPLDGLSCEYDPSDPACAAPASPCKPGSGAAACRFGDACTADPDCATGACDLGACSCPSDMVAVQSRFCVDRTEVSIAAYQGFLDTGAVPDEAKGACAFNGTFDFDVGQPDSPPECAPGPGRAPEMPASCIDWCDAVAYCKSRGRRLCGAIGGGAVALDRFADPAASEWFDACSAGGKREHPTGDYLPGACNGASTGPVPVEPDPAAAETCEGGFDGLVHMSGNVREWEDSCSGSSGPEDDCRVRGGSFDSGASPDDGYASVACGFDETVKRSDTTYDIGFRCCAG